MNPSRTTVVFVWFPFESEVRYGIDRLIRRTSGSGNQHLDRQRLDKWLWHARIVRTRADAAKLVSGGRVRLNSVRQTSPGHALKSGDVLTVALDARVRILKVSGFSERRGDAPSAQTLYDELNKQEK